MHIDWNLVGRFAQMIIILSVLVTGVIITITITATIMIHIMTIKKTTLITIMIIFILIMIILSDINIRVSGALRLSGAILRPACITLEERLMPVLPGNLNGLGLRVQMVSWSRKPFVLVTLQSKALDLRNPCMVNCEKSTTSGLRQSIRIRQVLSKLGSSRAMGYRNFLPDLKRQVL